MKTCEVEQADAIMIILPPAEELGRGRGDISMSVTFHSVAYATAMPIAGKLVDKFGARRVPTPSILLWGSA